MLNFEALEKGLGIVFQSHFVYDFLRKIFLIFLYSITDQISLINMCIAIVCEPGCDVRNLEINIFNQVVYMTKSSRKKT